MDIRENDIDDAKLLECMHTYIADPTRETLLGLVMELKEMDVFVPVMINQKKQRIQPYVIKNKEEEMYVPAFTSVSKFPEDQSYEGMQKLKYKQCVSMLLESGDVVQGLVLNPYSDNLMIKKQMLELSNQIEQEMPKFQTTTIKLDDFRMITRYNVEFRKIPGELFGKKLEFIKGLSAETLCDMYRHPYTEVNQEEHFEFTADDFDIMELDVREDMNIMQIMLPSKHLFQTNCREMYIVWNPQTEWICCYVVEKAADPQNGEFLLKEIRWDGSWVNLKEAPSEGNVMNYVMELFEASQQEQTE